MTDESPLGFKNVYYDRHLNKIFLKESSSDKYQEFEFAHT